MPTYLKLTGSRQGEIRGGVVQRGREGQIQIHSLDHGLARPDPAAVVATGRLRHSAVGFTKRIDQASPMLYTALVDGEPMSECFVNFWLPNPKLGSAGGDTLTYFIKLRDAMVTGIALSLADASAPDADTRIATETISLAYRSIEWTWTATDMTATASR